MNRSAYTNEIPAGTMNLSFNVPTELGLRIKAEAEERGVGLGDHIVSHLVIGYAVSGDVEAQKFTQDQMAARKPKVAAFWKNLLHLLHPRTYFTA